MAHDYEFRLQYRSLRKGSVDSCFPKIDFVTRRSWSLMETAESRTGIRYNHCASKSFIDGGKGINDRIPPRVGRYPNVYNHCPLLRTIFGSDLTLFCIRSSQSVRRREVTGHDGNSQPNTFSSSRFQRRQVLGRPCVKRMVILCTSNASFTEPAQYMVRASAPEF